MKISQIRLAIAAWIAPAGTVVVPPVHRTPMPLPDIVRVHRDTRQESPKGMSGTVHVSMLSATKPIYSDMLIVEQCRDPSMWYAKHVGEYFPNFGHMDGDWKTRDSSGFINVIRIADAKPVRTRPLPVKS